MSNDETTETADALTFSTFVAGNCNCFAYQASMALADAYPKAAFEMLFLHGGPGLGKTHLLHAIVNRLAERGLKGEVLLLTSEMFMSNLLAAMKGRNMTRFRSMIRAADMLLLEHVELFAGKEATQEELVQTLDLLQQSRKPIVITSVRAPKDLGDLGDRLRSRLCSGLSAGIDPPDNATRLGVIERMCSDAGVTFTEEVALYLAGIEYLDVRQLQGSVRKLIACERLLNLPVTIEHARQWLRDMLPSYGHLSQHDDAQG